jgi:hypothetical protein
MLIYLLLDSTCDICCANTLNSQLLLTIVPGSCIREARNAHKYVKNFNKTNIKIGSISKVFSVPLPSRDIYAISYDAWYNGHHYVHQTFHHYIILEHLLPQDEAPNCLASSSQCQRRTKMLLCRICRRDNT